MRVRRTRGSGDTELSRRGSSLIALPSYAAENALLYINEPACSWRMTDSQKNSREAGSSGPSLVDGWGTPHSTTTGDYKARTIELGVHALLTFLPKHLASTNVLSTP